MPRGYRHIKEYEKEILEMRVQEKTRREICEKYGFSMKQLSNFITRYNTSQKKLEAGIALEKKANHRKIILLESKIRFLN